MIQLRCPVCGLGGQVRATTTPVTITCPHPNGPYRLRPPAVMARTTDNLKETA